MEYKLTPRSPEIENSCRRDGKWSVIFDALPNNQAVELAIPTKREATRIGVNICSTLGRRGKGRRGKPYRIHYRIIQTGETFVLYVWKESR